MDLLNETYSELKRLNMVFHQTDFSTNWLNKSPRYYSMIKATGREPSVDTLARLATNLKARHEIYRKSRLGELRQRAEWIYPLTKKVWTEMYDKALQESIKWQFSKIWLTSSLSEYLMIAGLFCAKMDASLRAFFCNNILSRLVIWNLKIVPTWLNKF